MTLRTRTILLVALVAAAWLPAVLSVAQDNGATPAEAPKVEATRDAATPTNSSPPGPKTPADDGSPKSAGELAPDEEKKSNWLMQVFGPGMWPLWICSIVLVALVLERRKALRPDGVLDGAMIERVVELVGEKKLDEAQEVAAASPTVLGRAWAQGLHEFSIGGAPLGDTLTNSTVLAFKPLKRNLLALATLGVISPLFGLLGTVLGMIITFSQIAATGGADKAELAGGIGLALFTTAGGLIVAIPAILSNRYFTSRLTGFAERAEEAISRINYRHAHASANVETSGDTEAK
jgi:biopolymer transport protein ExbB